MEGNEDPKTQVESTVVAEAKPGAETSQVSEVIPAQQPGDNGEQPPITKAPRTYSEDEWKRHEAEITSAKDKEIQEHKTQLSRLHMQQRINQLVTQERQAQANDRLAVENGTISPEEAEQRSRARAETTRLSQVVDELKPQAEQLGRIQMANDLAKTYKDRYGVTIDPDVLIKDKGIKSPTEMIQKASDLALSSKNEELKAYKNPKKPEVFDGGPGTNGGGATNEEAMDRKMYPTMFKK